MGKDQEQFIERWAEIEEFLYESVSYDCLDFCENLFLYAHSIDDIRDGDFNVFSLIILFIISLKPDLIFLLVQCEFIINPIIVNTPHSK
jgi:hypothetical protein